MTQPLYARVKDHIRNNIAEGVWQTGARVPSENELVESFGISRMTANRALRELTSEGYLKRQPGVGTFVREASAPASVMELRNIADEIAARGNSHSSRLIAREKIVSSETLASEFKWRNPGTLYHLVMVHEENGLAVQLENRWLNPRKAADSLIQNFIRHKPGAHSANSVPVDELEQSITAILPNLREQQLLDIKENEPCIALHCRSWSNGDVISVATFIYPSSRYSLQSRHRPDRRSKLP